MDEYYKLLRALTVNAKVKRKARARYFQLSLF